MRILYVCSDFGIPVFGHKGASVHLRAMACALRALGHDVTVVSPATQRDGNHEFDVRVHTLALEEAHEQIVHELRRVDRGMQTFESGHAPRLGYEVRNLLYAQTVAAAPPHFTPPKVDLVYERYALFGSGGLALARRLEVPHLLEVNAPLVDEQDRARGLQLRKAALQIEKRVWCGSDAVLVVSEALGDHARRLGVAHERLHVVPNGVDAQRFTLPAPTRADVRKHYDVVAAEVIGFVGSLKSWHGTDVLMQAFARLHRKRAAARLWLVGDGPMRESLQRQAGACGVADAVTFMGAVDHARVPELVAGMDVAVAPYLPHANFYFSPIKVYEYMAAGVPIVASRLGEITPLADADLVTGVDAGDESGLAAALEQTLDGSQSSSARARRARDWVRQARTWEANARRIVDLAVHHASA
jgi:glycosyltransferase involved in cell wall biosynthesis